MSLYNLYKNGELMMTDTWKRVTSRRDTLAKSYRGKKVSLEIKEAETEDEKFKKKPKSTEWDAHNRRGANPKRIK